MAETTSGRRFPLHFSMPGIEIIYSVDRPSPREKKPSRVPAVAKTPDELEASFIRLFKDYTKAAAAARNKEEDCAAPEFADCEKKLIKVITDFRNLKIVYNNVHQLFPLVIELKEAVPSMIDLLKDDVCGERLASCILLTFEELTHLAFGVPGQEIQVGKLVKSLVEMGALEVFASTLGKFSEDDDLRAVQNIAQMIFEGGAAVAKTAGSNSQLMKWVLEAITGTKWDAKVCAVGFLNTLLMNSTENGLLLGMDTVPVVVDALSSLIVSPEEAKTEEEKRKEEEEDLPWTLFGCLFFLLEHAENKVHFVNAGGVETMIKLLQDGQKLGEYIYGSAIAALDIVKDSCPEASDKFANDDLGLDIAIFPVSMDMILPSTMHLKEEIEECLISLIESLTGCIGKKKKCTLLEKFRENDCERITWLMELFTRYSEKFDAAAAANHLKGKQLDSSELCKENLRDGFSTLQSIAVILGYLWLPEIKAKIESELSRHQIAKKRVLDILSAYRDNIGNTGGSAESPKTVIEEYVARLEENCDPSMELDAQGNSIQRVELDVPGKPYQRVEMEVELEVDVSSKRPRMQKRR